MNDLKKTVSYVFSIRHVSSFKSPRERNETGDHLCKRMHESVKSLSTSPHHRSPSLTKFSSIRHPSVLCVPICWSSKKASKARRALSKALSTRKSQETGRGRGNATECKARLSLLIMGGGGVGFGYCYQNFLQLGRRRSSGCKLW